MTQLFQRYFHWWPLFIIGLVYTFLVYTSWIKPTHKTIEFEAHLHSAQSGMLAVYPPQDAQPYSADSARLISFGAGESGHHFGFAEVSRGQLRMDFSSLDGRLSLLKLVTHRHITTTYSGKTLLERIADTPDARVTLDGDRLLLEVTGASPSIIFDSEFSGPLSPLLIWSFYAVGLIAILWVSLKWQPGKPEKIVPLVFCWVLAYLLLHYLLRNQASAILPLSNSVMWSLLAMLVLKGLLLAMRSELVRPDQLILTLSAASLLFAVFIFTYNPAALQHIFTVAQEEEPPRSQQAHLLQAKKHIENELARILYRGNDLIRADAKIKVFGLGFTPNAKTILGQDRWFFEGYGDRRVEQDLVQSYDNITDYMGLIPFTDDELARWKDALETRYYWLKQQGIDYVFALAPTKALIYPEKLHKRILALKQQLNRETRYLQLVNYLQTHSVIPVVDLRSKLLAVKPHSRPLFYRTDFHWNYLGAFYAYQAIVDTINQYYPGYAISPLSITDFRIEVNDQWAHPTFLRMAGLEPAEHQDDSYLTLFPLNPAHYQPDSAFYTQGINNYTVADVQDAQMAEKGATKQRYRLLENDRGDIPSMLIIGDSFSESILGYFSAHAKKVYNYRAVKQFLVEPIKQIKPDIVVQEILNMYILDKPPRNSSVLSDWAKNQR